MMKQTLLLATLALVARAAADAATTVVVGPERETCRPVLWTREEPAGSGPVRAVGAALELVSADRVVLLAADLPFLTRDVIEILLGAIEKDGAMLTDDHGRDQYLCSAWRTASLRGADLTADRLRELLGPLHARRVALPTVPGRPSPWLDCDTVEDLDRARELA